MSTVTVSCKTPNGILMQVGETTQVINGWNNSEGVIVRIDKREKAGITEDVPTALWKAWLEQHKNHPIVVNGLIFASETTSRAKAESKERQGVKSKMEALDPDKQVGGVSKAGE